LLGARQIGGLDGTDFKSSHTGVASRTLTSDNNFVTIIRQMIELQSYIDENGNERQGRGKNKK